VNVRRRSPLALVSALLITTSSFALACKREQAVSESPDAAPGETGRAAELRALADAIDPGRVTPMSAELPPSIAEQVALTDTRPEAEREAMIREAVDMFASAESFALLGQPGPLLALAQAIAVLEARDANAQASVAELHDLQTLYAVLDQPVFAHERGMMAQFVPTALAAARADGAENLEDLDDFVATVFERMRRAEPLRRALVARLLRDAPEHPSVPSLLGSMAGNLTRLDPQLALAAVRLARELDPDPGPERELDLAYQCCLVFDLACADAALERASGDTGRLDDATRKRLERLQTTRASAGRAVSSVAARDLDGRLEHARALFDLGLYADAEPVFASLRDEYPDDVRPRTGLARIAMIGSIDVVAAARILDDAGTLAHRDAEYYEIAIAARILNLFHQVLPRISEGGGSIEAALVQPLARLRVDIEGFMAEGSELAVVLAALLDLTERGLPLLTAGDQAGMAALALEALDQAVELQRRLPEQPHAYVLLMAAAELLPDKRAAVAAASTPVPSGGGSDLHLRRAQALVNLAILWADPSLLAGVEAEIAAIPAGEHAQATMLTAANMLAIEARLAGQSESLREAMHWYEQAFQRFGDTSALNNLGVLLAIADPEQAAGAFARAVELGGEDAIVASLNAALLDRSSAGMAGLEAIADDPSANETVRRMAMAELAARSIGKPAATWAERRRASLAEPTVLPRGLDLPNRAGALLLGKLDFDVSYAVSGMVFTADAASTVWLVPISSAPRR
jgi:tetratricopeptide (TPR) repeat protein